jgi:anti-sigma factor RsiW
VAFLDDEVNPVRSPLNPASAVGVVEIGHDLIREVLDGFLDGSLGEPDRSRVEQHLSECGSCRAYLATYDATLEAVGKLPRVPAPADAKRRLLRMAKD